MDSFLILLNRNFYVSVSKTGCDTITYGIHNNSWKDLKTIYEQHLQLIMSDKFAHICLKLLPKNASSHLVNYARPGQPPLFAMS